MILDRTKPPASHPIKPIQFPVPKSFKLENGIDVHSISLGDQPVFKLELVFPAGSIYTHKSGISGLTSQMMKRGTKSADSLQLNEAFDFYGAYWDIQAHMDTSSIVIYSLCKHLPNLLPLVIDILENSLIDQQDFEQELTIETQKVKLNWEKTSHAASHHFRGLLFENDPYGRIIDEDSLKNIQHADILSFYSSHWKGTKPMVIISGKIGEEEFKILDQTIGKLKFKPKKTNDIGTAQYSTQNQLYIEKENALQTSIRFGKIGLDRRNPDYFKFSVMNTILGGFFGSRLQKNIREEKGFTYGISSSNVALQRAAYWVVGTDVNKENANQTIDEIRKEIKLLQEIPVDKEELDLVKNYLMGSFTGELTQAFEISEKVKIICLEDLGFDFYNEFQHQIMNCTSDDIQRLANAYLTEEMIDVRVG